MNPALLGLVGLRALALALSLQGNTKAADKLFALADTAEAGGRVDAALSAVAEKLKSRPANDDDWSDVTARIEADSARLQGS